MKTREQAEAKAREWVEYTFPVPPFAEPRFFCSKAMMAMYDWLIQNLDTITITSRPDGLVVGDTYEIPEPQPSKPRSLLFYEALTEHFGKEPKPGIEKDEDYVMTFADCRNICDLYANKIVTEPQPEQPTVNHSIVKHPIMANGKENKKVTYCYSCGTTVRNQKYCHWCGRKLIWDKVEPTAEQPTKTAEQITPQTWLCLNGYGSLEPYIFDRILEALEAYADQFKPKTEKP